MSGPTKTRSLLATARIANVPSVISNVWVGVALATLVWGWDGDEVWLRAALLALAGMLLYLAGNFFNDWKDREWDALHRPERALPRGLFSPAGYFRTGLACGLGGALCAFLVSAWSGVIALTILSSIATYTRWHKTSGWAVIPMSLCRVLLPVMGVFAVVPANSPGRDPALTLLVAVHAAALFCYICGLSISAREEAKAAMTDRPPVIGRVLLLMSVLIALMPWIRWPMHSEWVAPIPVALWLVLALTVYRRPISAHVSALLAGIPLLDLIPLLPLARDLGGELGWFANSFIATCVLLPLLAFYVGRRLQQLAPAT